MPIEPVKIPQNVYIEDRIVGPITMRQLIIMGVGGGFSYMLYSGLSKANGAPLSIPVTVAVWIPAAIAAAFALVKINDLSLTRICLLLIESMNKPSVRTWNPRRGIVINIRTSFSQEEKDKQQRTKSRQEAEEQRAAQRIGELSSVVDRPTVSESMVEPASGMRGEAPLPDIDLSENLDPLAGVDRDDAPLPPLPVNPKKISADAPGHALEFSDLSVFRDILPPSSHV